MKKTGAQLRGSWWFCCKLADSDRSQLVLPIWTTSSPCYNPNQAFQKELTKWPDKWPNVNLWGHECLTHPLSGNVTCQHWLSWISNLWTVLHSSDLSSDTSDSNALLGFSCFFRGVGFGQFNKSTPLPALLLFLSKLDRQQPQSIGLCTVLILSERIQNPLTQYLVLYLCLFSIRLEMQPDMIN